jgi:hypothetical protein
VLASLNVQLLDVKRLTESIEALIYKRKKKYLRKIITQKIDLCALYIILAVASKIINIEKPEIQLRSTNK